MFLPKCKFRITQAKPNEYALSDGTEYVGPIIETFKGEKYAGSDPLHTAGQLHSIVEEGVEKELPYAIRRVPTEEEYAQGFMIRYFCQDLRTLKVIELLKKGYEIEIKESKSTFKYVTGTWILVGLSEDKLSGLQSNYSVSEVYSRNQKEIDRLEKLVPGISSSGVLCNSSQFVREI